MQSVTVQLLDDRGQELTPPVHLPREPQPFDALDIDGDRYEIADEPATIRVRRVGQARSVVYQLRARRLDAQADEQ